MIDWLTIIAVALVLLCWSVAFLLGRLSARGDVWDEVWRLLWAPEPTIKAPKQSHTKEREASNGLPLPVGIGGHAREERRRVLESEKAESEHRKLVRQFSKRKLST